MPRFVGPAEGVNVARQFSSRLPRAVAVTALRLISQFTGQGRRCRPCMVWPPGGVNIARQFSSRRPKGSHCHRARAHFAIYWGVSPSTVQGSLRVPAVGGGGQSRGAVKFVKPIFTPSFTQPAHPARWPGGHRRGGFWHAQKPLVSVPTMGFLQVAARHPMHWVPPA